MEARNYAVRAVGSLIPVDHETCEQMVDYAMTLPSTEQMQSHFLNLLGESEDALNFVTRFCQLVEKDKNQNRKKESVSSPKPSSNIISSTSRMTNTKTQPKKSNTAWGSQEQEKPKIQNKARLSSNNKSATTSELLNSKPSQQTSAQQAKRSKRKVVDNLKDIEAALTELEVKSNTSENSQVNRRCNCMATRHPLFEFAPNCLNCGKIICTKEGLQPCSSCGKELLSYKERREIMSILRDEKYDMENKTTEKKPEQSSGRKQQKFVVSMSAGSGSLFEQQNIALKKAEAIKHKETERLREELEMAEKELEQAKELEYYSQIKDVNPELIKAQERLETLLNFQATGAERTKIIDQASDFDLPNIASANLWSSPVERALQLKRQQKQMRKQEEIEKTRVGRGKKVVDMTIKDGKVILREKVIVAEADEDDDTNLEIKDLEEQINGIKLKDENDKTKKIWDFEQDKKKWERPIYVKSSAVENASEEDADTGLDLQDTLSKWARVQFDKVEETPELLVSLPTA